MVLEKSMTTITKMTTLSAVVNISLRTWSENNQTNFQQATIATVVVAVAVAAALVTVTLGGSQVVVIVAQLVIITTATA